MAETGRMPAAFLGHGNPHERPGPQPLHRSVARLGANVGRPAGVLCISLTGTPTPPL